MLAFHRNYRLPALVLLAVLIGGGVFFFSKTVFLKNRVTQTVVASKNVEVDVRSELWGAAVTMWKDYVWFGMGPGHFDHRFRAYRPAAIQLQPDRVHNDYLNTLVDWGVIGAAIITLALGALFAGLARTWNPIVGQGRSGQTGNKFAFVLGSAAGLVALLVHSVVDFNMQIPANAIASASWLLTSRHRFATERCWVTARCGPG